MTKIEFSVNKEKIVGFLIKGHSEAGIYGEDIVCASISSTTLMTINALIEILKVKELKYEIKDGYVLCDLRNLNEDDFKKSQDFLKSLKTFLNQISKDYPKNVQFRIRRYEK